MKSRIALFSALLCATCAFAASASDCVGDDCDIGQLYQQTVARVESLEPDVCVDCAPPVMMDLWMAPPRMKSVNLLSIKPAVPDDRPKLWDGGIKKYNQPHFDKTVDWRDGVPIWDDSIHHYQRKDFSDWFLEPSETYFVDELNTDIRAEVEELLAPQRPSDNLWTNSAEKYQARDLSAAIEETFVDNVKIIEISDGCPFETDAECAIWRRKPMVRETVSPRSSKIRADKMDEFICAARDDNRITANADVSAPLLDRYKMLMQSARACCADGMAHRLKQAGATDGLVYKFLSDDANFYGLGNRCLMMTDADFDRKYPNTATAAVAADVRNGCLCRGRQWFKAMLSPFQEAYKASPEFAAEKFDYTYTDGLQREITVSVNNDVKNVLNQLSLCP
ncbi:MAG: hypothetical protein LBJ73_03755 [Rickettsiales bacterium]|jgi:hypothetical protein|nr:hypothetical protein [Rickettsiales bacterium]